MVVDQAGQLGFRRRATPLLGPRVFQSLDDRCGDLDAIARRRARVIGKQRVGAEEQRADQQEMHEWLAKQSCHIGSPHAVDQQLIQLDHLAVGIKQHADTHRDGAGSIIRRVRGSRRLTPIATAYGVYQIGEV